MLSSKKTIMKATRRARKRLGESTAREEIRARYVYEMVEPHGVDILATAEDLAPSGLFNARSGVYEYLVDGGPQVTIKYQPDTGLPVATTAGGSRLHWGPDEARRLANSTRFGLTVERGDAIKLLADFLDSDTRAPASEIVDLGMPASVIGRFPVDDFDFLLNTSPSWPKSAEDEPGEYWARGTRLDAAGIRVFVERENGKYWWGWAGVMLGGRVVGVRKCPARARTRGAMWADVLRWLHSLC